MSTIAVNLLWCVPGDVGGSEQYLVRQMRGLAAHPHGHEIEMYVLPGLTDSHPGLAEIGRIHTAPFSGRRRVGRVAGEHTWLAWHDRAADVVHHGGGTVPAVGGRPVVLTVHDLQFRAYPHYFSPLKRVYLARRLPRSVGRAAVVTVPSEFVRGTVIQSFSIAPERVVVVPHGVEPDLGTRATAPEVLRARYGIGPRRLILLPAATYPHKGHRFLLRLLATHWTDPDLCAMFIGAPGLAEAEIAADIERSGLSTRVLRPGRVPTDDRDGLIAMAEAVVFPSEYEGFGAPLIEAMALGTPVIASDTTAIPEVVGSAGLTLPLEPDAWVGALDLVAARRSAMIDAGRRQVTRFTIERSAAALLSAYRLALG